MAPRLLLAALLTPAIAACDIAGGCGNETVRRAAAPDGVHDPILFQRDCGATTGFSTQVSVVAHGAAPRGGGNAFVADDDHGKAADTPWHGPWAGLRWLAADRLLIVSDLDARVFRQAERVDGVTLIYRTRRAAAGAPAGG
jgi:hypothetical protein